MNDEGSSRVSGSVVSRRSALLACVGMLLVAGVLLNRVYGSWPGDEGTVFGCPVFRWKAALGAGVFCAGVMAASVGLGSLFWWMVSRVAGAHWSDGLRGVWLGLCRASVWGWLLALLVLCVMLPVLYPWAVEAVRAAMSGHAAPSAGTVRGWWLQDGFFQGRSIAVCVLFVAMFSLMGRLFRHGRAKYERAAAAVCLPLLMLAVAVLGVDWWMVRSVWVSSMLPFCFLAFCAVAALAAAVLAGGGRMTRGVRRRLGVLLMVALAFKVYFSYSQFMLIQYANIPHELAFFQARMQGMWMGWTQVLSGVWVALVLLLAFVPACRRRRVPLAVVAVAVLLASAAEGFWYVAPAVEWDVLGWGAVAVYAGCLCVAGLGMWLLYRAFGDREEEE